MVKPKNQHIRQMELVSDSQLLELLHVEGYFYWSEKIICAQMVTKNCSLFQY